MNQILRKYLKGKGLKGKKLKKKLKQAVKVKRPKSSCALLSDVIIKKLGKMCRN